MERKLLGDMKDIRFFFTTKRFVIMYEHFFFPLSYHIYLNVIYSTT